ncbi:MAG: glycogen/starch/alpha-glucan phosphorylase, partial [Candidatus Delongbacteria bacterium]|nr:glycogen/starch/alpha-glucan phosphorylase [Candidatus Delongbacteria bacterium]
LRTQQEYKEKDVKRVYYLSLEFLMGRLLGNTLINMNYYDQCYNILKQEGYNLETIKEMENDMGLGNGGLGRLAACFLDSMATNQYPSFGYGIRYEFGIFSQAIENGWQTEQPDHWLSYGNPWEIFRRELKFRVKFFGEVVLRGKNDKGRLQYDWIKTDDVYAVAYDIPVPGYNNSTVNNLRLWQAKATNEFSFHEFNSGNYIAAVENKNLSENISKVLYPNDSSEEGKYLRLKQQYFFVSASLQDIIRKYKINHKKYDLFAEKTAIQLNDTHPVIAIPELMRILLDEEGLGWDFAWEITTKTFAYTNHTVVPEALEEWPVSLMETLLPRHMQIIYEINQRFLDMVRNSICQDGGFIEKVSIIREFPEKRIRMANLAIVGSHCINGVAELHSTILKELIFPEFYRIYPHKFTNITNGISPRRWLKAANPMMGLFLDERIGTSWATRLEELRKLEEFIDNPQFLDSWHAIKWTNKDLLKDYIARDTGIIINPESLFDVQIKRFHEYKRQLLNLLHVITLYFRIKDEPGVDRVPRTVIFAGKAAPAYFMAKLIIKLIHSVADTVNHDPDIKDRLKVVFLKNYSVSLAERIIPATNLSEQISTAGLEASGTGNMKFALNGALTIGTMDGANVEIRQEVGEENIFIFGLLAHQVQELKQNGYYPRHTYEHNPELKRVIDSLDQNYFNREEPGIFQPIVQELLNTDNYCLLADYQSYIDTQHKVEQLFLDSTEWTRKSILNCSRMGKFSSDRSIREYAEKIWNVEPMPMNKIR